MNTETITIQGVEFTAPVRYSEGHTLSAGEASGLNQLLHENLRNNFAKKVKDAKDAGSFDAEAFQAQFDEYANKYEFGVRTAGGGGGRGPTDPVKKEALRLSKETVIAKLKAKGKTIGPKGNYTMAQVSDAAERYLEARPELTETARANVERIKAEAAQGGDDLDDLISEEQAPASDTPADAPTAEAA